MALTSVDLTSEVFRTCVGHALTTEAEEIMGLLLGDIMYDQWGRASARIWAAMPQIRTDRRKDRVEASPEQLAQASALAERLTEDSQRTTRVIGWYHSHPHITVLPSHVDIRTQAMYQTMEEGFIGLIFSVFNQDGDKNQRVQMTAFQSQHQGSPTVLAQRGSWDFDSPMAAAVSASMEEARKVSSTQGQWVHKRVPVSVSPGSSASSTDSMTTVCRMLFQEEQHAFRQAAEEASDSKGFIDPLTALHQAAEYQQHLARLIELVLAPSLQTLRTARVQAQWQQQQLRDLRDILHHNSQTGASSGKASFEAAPTLPHQNGKQNSLHTLAEPRASKASAVSQSPKQQSALGGVRQAEAASQLASARRSEDSGAGPSSSLSGTAQPAWGLPTYIPEPREAFNGRPDPSAQIAAEDQPSSTVQVTLTEWVRDGHGDQASSLEQLQSSELDADLAAAIEASKLTAPGPYWDAEVLEDKDRTDYGHQEAENSRAAHGPERPHSQEQLEAALAAHGLEELHDPSSQMQYELDPGPREQRHPATTEAALKGQRGVDQKEGSNTVKGQTSRGGSSAKSLRTVDPFSSLWEHAALDRGNQPWMKKA